MPSGPASDERHRRDEVTLSLVDTVATQDPAPHTRQTETFTRVERKFLVNPNRFGLVRAWLAHTCRPAPDYPEGQVSSCYYDTPDLDEYFASFDGDLDKHKVRLRWYDSLPSSGEVTAFVELKSKRGAETTKRRTPLTVPASALAEEDFAAALPHDMLNRCLLGFGYRAPFDLRPTVVITYHRFRFVEPHSGMTVSLDSNIRAWLVGELPRWPPVSLKAAVLELKGRALELPLRLRALDRFGPVWTAYSKYASAIEALADAPGPFEL
jgi:hypothetical protein